MRTQAIALFAAMWMAFALTPASLADVGVAECAPAIATASDHTLVVTHPCTPSNQASGASGAPADATPGCAVPLRDDRCEAWVSARFDGPGQGHDRIGPGTSAEGSTTLSPDGETVFVAVTSDVAPSSPIDFDTSVLAYDTRSGAQRWRTDYAGPARHAYAQWVVASPDGTRVYVGTDLNDAGGAAGAVVLALDAATGAQLWSTMLDTDSTEEVEIVARGAGDRLLISRHRGLDNQPVGMEVLALDVTDAGASVAWEARWQGSTPWGSTGGRLAVSPDGRRLFLGGGENAEDGLRNNFATIAYDVDTGERLWEVLEPRIHPEGFFDTNGVSGLAVSPDGATVYSLGFDPKSKSNQISDLSRSTSAILLQAYDAVTGERRWQTRYLGADGLGFFFNLFDRPLDLSFDGRHLAVVSETPHGMPYSMGYTAVLFDPATGEARWSVSDGEPIGAMTGYVGYYSQVAFASDGASVIVTDRRGHHQTMRAITTSFAAADGARRWSAQYTTGSTYPRGLAVTPTRVVIPTLTRSFQSVGFPAPDPNLDSSDVQVIAYEP
jgi:DNA-binding beta-propeller fold protein YncE